MGISRAGAFMALAIGLPAAMTGFPAAREPYEARPRMVPAGGIVIFYGAQGPLSYQTLTPRELPPSAAPIGPVQGRGCQYGVSLPTTLSLRGTNVSGAAGEGGFKKALRDILKSHPNLAGIYDVKSDRHIVSVLGVFRRLCIEVSALGFETKPAAP